MLKIAPGALAAIRGQAEEGYPLEVCGFLIGRTAGDMREAVEVYPVRNAWEDDPEERARMVAGFAAAGGDASAEQWEKFSEERRFLISPQDQLACMKQARTAGLDIVGLYHSHPEHPSVPSAMDRDAAWPSWSYPIVSVRQGKAVEVRSWVLSEETGQFVEEAVQEVD